MDAIVEAALRKWPNVPHCHGWLALGARGDWFMRDERTQRAGPFPQVRGSRIEHAKLREFIERNYAVDADGGWFFQNGPQRVYVDLEVAPFVWRLRAADAPGLAPAVTAHTGAKAVPRECVLDEQGRVYLDCDLGFGLVHTLDTALAAEAVEQGLWTPRLQPAAQMPERYGYRLTPRPAA